MTESWPPPPGGTPGPPWNPYAPQPARRTGVPVWLIVLLIVAALLLVATLVIGAVLLVRNSDGETSSGDARVGEVASPSTEARDGDTKYAGALEVGDCYFEPEFENDVVYNVETVACAEPHDAEVYLAFDLPKGDFPGDDEVDESADDRCFEAFEPFVGMVYEESVLDYTYLTPTEESWKTGDREVTCSIYEPTIDDDGNPVGLEPVTGTLRNADR